MNYSCLKKYILKQRNRFGLQNRFLYSDENLFAFGFYIQILCGLSSFKRNIIFVFPGGKYKNPLYYAEVSGNYYNLSIYDHSENGVLTPSLFRGLIFLNVIFICNILLDSSGSNTYALFLDNFLNIP